MAANHEFKTLDGMRGVAAMAVVLFHARFMLGLPSAASGYLAVDFFFVLSGFVIAHAYEQRLLADLGPWRFFRMRLVRFYPLYLAGLMLGVVAGLAAAILRPATELAPQQVAGVAALNGFFLPAPLDRDGNLFPLNPPAWSLFFELLVNLLYALAVRRLSSRTVGAIAAISGVALAATILGHGDAEFGVWISGFGGGLARTVFSFSVGVLLYRWRPNVGRPSTGLLMAILAALLMAPIPPGPGRAAFDLAFVFAASPALVAFGAASRPSKALAPFCAYMGEISFAIYALHYPLLWVAHAAARILPQEGLLMCLAAILILLAGCPLVVRLYDEPVRRRMRVRAPVMRAAQ